MATLVLSAVGTALGGPLGGALGALIGNQVDRTVFGSSSREGPRLKELQVSTSSYGTPIGRHFGKVRAPGSIIWATDLVESTEKSGGGKGKPSTTSYSYSTSFAVALASRPIAGVGRIWADGNLLRGAAGDLKTGGELRIYNGHGDQVVDPLIGSDKGADAPAFRDLAYCVFDTLQLADFGNRIPSLTFEIIADDGAFGLTQILPAGGNPLLVDRPLDALEGFTDEGGPLTSSLSTIHQVYPFTCDAGGEALVIRSAGAIPASVPTLPQSAADPSNESFAVASGASRKRQPDTDGIPEALRYYDIARDFQPGLQRTDGRARPGRSRIIEFPGSLSADKARDLANEAAERASSARERLSWRMAELDPAIGPGAVVSVPGRPGLWLIESWEWRETGVELDLLRLPHGPARTAPADAGASLRQTDLVATPTDLAAYELPWDGTGSGEERQVFAAASSASSSWTGAAIYAVHDSGLDHIGVTGRTRCIIGTTQSSLPACNPALLNDRTTLHVELVSDEFELLPATPAGLANGANRALIGGEIIQFGSCERIDGALWRLGNILRGRGGNEHLASSENPAGQAFVVLDDKALRLDPVKLSGVQATAAIGIADAEPVFAAISGIGSSLRPLTPVHPRIRRYEDRSLDLTWARRARGAWQWPDAVEVPLNEQSEAYIVGVGPPAEPVLVWEVGEPVLHINEVQITNLGLQYPGEPIWVRQVGNNSLSLPLHLLTID